MSNRTERECDYTEVDARSTLSIWRMLASEIRAHFVAIGGRDREQSPRAARRRKGRHERWFVTEVVVVGIVGGALLISAALLAPVLWTAMRDNFWQHDAGRHQVPNSAVGTLARQ